MRDPHRLHRREFRIGRIHVARAGREARRPGEVRERGSTSSITRPCVPSGCPLTLPITGIMLGWRPAQARGHFAIGQAVARHRALNSLTATARGDAVRAPLRAVNDARCTLAQLLLAGQRCPVDVRDLSPADAAASGAAPNGCLRWRAMRGAAGAAASRAVRPAGSRTGAPVRARGMRPFPPERAQPVAREHQLLQPRAIADIGRQCVDGVVGEDQPAQRARQRPARHRLNPVRLEADHVELPARAEHVGERGEAVAGREQDAQAVQPRQVVRQCGQRIAGEVEHFERVGEIEDRAREFRQPACELELPCAGELAGLQLFEGVCHAGKTGGGCDDRRVDRPNSTGIACVHSPILSHPFTNAQRR